MRFAVLSISSLLLASSLLGQLKVGTGLAEITPTVVPFQLRSGPSEFVHDPLHVRAFAFQNGEGRFTIAIIDAIGSGREMTDEVKALVEKETGWPAANILVAGTHAHSTPKGGKGSPGREAYDQLRREGLRRALTSAITSLQPAQIGFASDKVPSEVFNRRWFLREGTMPPNPLGGLDQVKMNPNRQDIVRPAGPTDPDVSVLHVLDARGRPLAHLANYALHYVGGIPRKLDADGREHGMASADYFGEFARLMPHRLMNPRPADAFVAAMSNGASGDINNIDFDLTRPPREPFEQVRIVARKTSDAAWRAVSKIKTYDSDAAVGIVQREVQLPRLVPSEEEVAKALEILGRPKQEQLAINKRTPGVARNTVASAEPDAPRHVPALLQAARIGDQAIVSIPFEVLVEIGLELKKRSPFPHTMIISHANGANGYLPTPAQHQLGGYETWLGTCRVAPESSEILVEALLEMLGELR